MQIEVLSCVLDGEQMAPFSVVIMDDERDVAFEVGKAVIDRLRPINTFGIWAVDRTGQETTFTDDNGNLCTIKRGERSRNAAAFALTLQGVTELEYMLEGHTVTLLSKG